MGFWFSLRNVQLTTVVRRIQTVQPVLAAQMVAVRDKRFLLFASLFPFFWFIPLR
jgi:hypothetical protein